MDMSNQESKPLPEPNPVTFGAHRRQRLAQIYLPMAVAMIGIIVLAVFAARGSNDQVAQWGTVSTIVVVAPTLISCLIALAILAVFIVLITKLLQVLPGVSQLIQMRLHQISAALHNLADKMAAPVIKTSSLSAAIKAAFGRRT